MATPEQIRAVQAAVRAKRFIYNNEKHLQVMLAATFSDAGIPARAEHPLGNGRVDFMLWEDVALEVKVKGSPAAVLRQLQRYAADPACGALVLVTGRRKLGAVPPVLEGKPVFVISLWATCL